MEVSPKDGINALIHLYRGELGRMIAYRVRLDTTTRWAVATSAAIMSFSLTDARVPHLVFVLAVWLNLLFLWLEARRFRGYALIRHRVRLLERGFYGEVLGGQPPGAEAGAGWKAELQKSIEAPAPRVGYLAACSVRLRRVYLWLMGAVYGAWLVKLHYHGGIPEGAEVGALSGVGVLAIAFSLLGLLVVLACVSWPPDED